MDVGAGRRREAGLTLLELVLSAALLAILAAAAMPLFEVSVRRSREIELRRGLRVIRQAIDQFHLSYVASGGKTSQGPVILPGAASGQGGAPGTASQVTPSSPLGGQPGQPSAGRTRNPPGALGRRQSPIELIDYSQFDPIDSKGYPPDLETLMEGVQAFGGTSDDLVRFLRRLPRDPMVPVDPADENDPNFGWGVCSYQDGSDCPKQGKVWGRQNVYDVYTRSQGKALDGSKYREW